MAAKAVSCPLTKRPYLTAEASPQFAEFVKHAPLGFLHIERVDRVSSKRGKLKRLVLLATDVLFVSDDVKSMRDLTQKRYPQTKHISAVRHKPGDQDQVHLAIPTEYDIVLEFPPHNAKDGPSSAATFCDIVHALRTEHERQQVTGRVKWEGLKRVPATTDLVASAQMKRPKGFMPKLPDSLTPGCKSPVVVAAAEPAVDVPPPADASVPAADADAAGAVPPHQQGQVPQPVKTHPSPVGEPHTAGAVPPHKMYRGRGPRKGLAAANMVCPACDKVDLHMDPDGYVSCMTCPKVVCTKCFGGVDFELVAEDGQSPQRVVPGHVMAANDDAAMEADRLRAELEEERRRAQKAEEQLQQLLAAKPEEPVGVQTQQPQEATPVAAAQSPPAGIAHPSPPVGTSAERVSLSPAPVPARPPPPCPPPTWCYQEIRNPDPAPGADEFVYKKRLVEVLYDNVNGSQVRISSKRKVVEAILLSHITKVGPATPKADTLMALGLSFSITALGTEVVLLTPTPVEKEAWIAWLHYANPQSIAPADDA